MGLTREVCGQDLGSDKGPNFLGTTFLVNFQLKKKALSLPISAPIL
jgi:hypothetical protein